MPRKWGYAIEIEPKTASLLELTKAAREYLSAHPSEHEVAVVQPPRLVIKFVDEFSARNFYFAHGKWDARFCLVPTLDEKAPKP